MKPLNTYYDILQVSRSANDTVLQAAFKTLCDKYHPDKDPDDLTGATPEMVQLSEAYAVLSDSEKRFAYDLSLTKRERELRAEEEAKAAKAASGMFFPPIEMPPDLPEPPSAPAAASGPAPAKAVPPAAAHAPRSHAPAAAAAREPLDFAPTTVEPLPSEQAGFADTQPQSEAEPAAPVAARRPIVPAPVRGHPAVEWLRERPAALVAALLMGVAVVALAPWMLRVVHVATQSDAPVITPDLQPTYVEPPVAPAPVEVASAPLEPAAVAADSGVSEPAAALVGAAAVAAAAQVAEPPPAARSAKRVVKKTKTTVVAKKAPEPEAPARAPEPAPAPPVLDPGGHSGFAPKCRWVTPVKWSCD